MTVEWHGTPEEAASLEHVLNVNCQCEYDVSGLRVITCAAHKAMVDDQRFLDGALAMRHCASKLTEQEFEEPKEKRQQ